MKTIQKMINLKFDIELEMSLTISQKPYKQYFKSRVEYNSTNDSNSHTINIKSFCRMSQCHIVVIQCFMEKISIINICNLLQVSANAICLN